MILQPDKNLEGTSMHNRVEILERSQVMNMVGAPKHVQKALEALGGDKSPPVTPLQLTKQSSTIHINRLFSRQSFSAKSHFVLVKTVTPCAFLQHFRPSKRAQLRHARHGWAAGALVASSKTQRCATGG